MGQEFKKEQKSEEALLLEVYKNDTTKVYKTLKRIDMKVEVNYQEEWGKRIVSIGACIACPHSCDYGDEGYPEFICLLLNTDLPHPHKIPTECPLPKE